MKGTCVFLPQLPHKHSEKITTVVLTGGPCAGKTTLMEKFRNEVDSSSKVRVFFAKEAATFLKQSGINVKDAGGDDTFQRMIIQQQLIAEYNAYAAAEKFASQNPEYTVIIVCDRGIMDGEAYFENKNEFLQLLADFELTPKTIYKRYDMVLFLRSAAVGAAGFYTTVDGTPRDETPEEAIALDTGVYNAWCEHPNFNAVENSFKFYEKLDVAVSYILKAAGIIAPDKFFRRYLIQAPNLVSLISEYNTTTTNEQIFFLNSKNEENVYSLKIQRKGNETRYMKREVRLGMAKNDNGVEEYTRIFQNEGTITENNFLKELPRLNPNILPLNRTLLAFYHGFSVRCELEIYPLYQNHMILKVYMDSEKDYELISSYFDIIKDVTDDMDYCTLALAKTACSVLKLSEN